MTTLKTIGDTLIDFAMEYANDDSLKSSKECINEALTTIETIMSERVIPHERDVDYDEPDDEVFNEAIGYNQAINDTKANLKHVIYGEKV